MKKMFDKKKEEKKERKNKAETEINSYKNQSS